MEHGECVKGNSKQWSEIKSEMTGKASGGDREGYGWTTNPETTPGKERSSDTSVPEAKSHKCSGGVYLATGPELGQRLEAAKPAVYKGEDYSHRYHGRSTGQEWYYWSIYGVDLEDPSWRC